MNQAQSSEWGIEPTSHEASQPSGSTFEHLKTTVAEKLRAASGTISQKSSEMAGGNQNVSNYGRQAATWLGRSADYIEDFEPRQLRNDIENQVRQNPGRSLLIAGAAGLVIGAILRRR